jgi:methylated-DNA-[protein]-cysteine S-methyltransferase
MKEIYYYNSPIGTLKIVASEGYLNEISFAKKKEENSSNLSPIILTCKEQLDLYFLGKLQTFNIPIKFLIGTPFQQEVWQALCKIPYGKTVSYKQIAQNIKREKAVRAVGGANNKNPIVIVVPCHRVIGANGKLVGYGGGIDKKEYLLNLEKENLK